MSKHASPPLNVLRPRRAGSTVWHKVGRTQEILQLCKAVTELPAAARAAHTCQAKFALCRGCSSAEQEPQIACGHPAPVLMPSMHGCGTEPLCLCKGRSVSQQTHALRREVLTLTLTGM